MRQDTFYRQPILPPPRQLALPLVLDPQPPSLTAVPSLRPCEVWLELSDQRRDAVRAILLKVLREVVRDG